jgi:hypothetical protein
MFYCKLSKCLLLYRKISLTKPREIRKKNQCCNLNFTMILTFLDVIESKLVCLHAQIKKNAAQNYLFNFTELSSLRTDRKNMLSFVDNINRYD